MTFARTRGIRVTRAGVVNVGEEVAGSRTLASFADEAAAIQKNAAVSRGLNPQSKIQAALKPVDVPIDKLIPPASRPFADPAKLAKHGPFDWNKYTPIEVETDGVSYWVQNGMTRIENARQAGIKTLPAYVYPR